MKPELIMVAYFDGVDSGSHCGDCYYHPAYKKCPMTTDGDTNLYECCGNRAGTTDNHTHIWIENTPKAIAAYTAKRLMK